MSIEPVLTDEEATRLLEMIKKSLEKAITFPNKNEKVEFNAQGDSPRDMFSISIFRGKINATKYSYGARISKNGIVLLALDINKTGKHRNPDGTIIEGSHWHIYTSEHGRSFAIPAADIDDANFIENTMLFFRKFFFENFFFGAGFAPFSS